jgi:hypothetical protein
MAMTPDNIQPDMTSTIRPKILITDTNRWPVGPRLAMAFSKMECEVAVLCPSPGHPIEKTGAVHQIFRHRGLNPLKALSSAIESFNPDIIIPLCDRGVQHLHDLYRLVNSRGSSDRKIVQLIERSLGSPNSFRIVSSRHDLLKLAHSEGVLIPGMIAVEGEGDLNSWNEETAPHWVMKADGTWGGRGVREANSTTEAKRNLHELIQHPGLIELTKRLLLNRDRAWILSERKQARPGIIAQSFIDGRPANCAAVCWEGELLAGICVEVVQALGPKEPATVVQVVEGAEMMRAAERIAKRLKLSGFFGLDFVIENGTGLIYLIEMNPRCTPPCPLPLGKGRDLVAALCAQLAGRPMPDRACVTTKSKIAYFPQCCESGGSITDSRMADGVYYDVPEEEPELVQELLHPWSARSYLGQLLDWVREISGRKRTLTPRVFEGAMESIKTDGAVDVVPSQLRSK